MKKTFFLVFVAILTAFSLCTSCSKEEITEWNITCNADLGGDFQIIADAVITISNETFTADITTIQIGGAAEEHQFQITGTVDNDRLTVLNSEFELMMNNEIEYVTLTTGAIDLNGNQLTGTGTMTVIPAGMTTPINGIYNLTGTKK